MVILRARGCEVRGWERMNKVAHKAKRKWKMGPSKRRRGVGNGPLL